MKRPPHLGLPTAAMREFVSDTGPLISFERIPDGFGLLRRIARGIVVPLEVLEELEAGRGGKGAYLTGQGIEEFVRVMVAPPVLAVSRGLHTGEAAAIALALNRGLPLLIEERKGREIACALGIDTIGPVGLILAAWQIGRLTTEEAELAFTALRDGGRINRSLLEALMARIRPT
ncbi:hypothetical protein [Rhodocista pekingensis]|uniref:DUF3368 domain-containing protein n=1 Tax=Rhodocista pekingensis TaxID=201185 RepID=A0ABW2KXD3_9PROT